MSSELQKLSFARQALAEAKSLDEIKQIKDIAVAAKAYTKAKGMSVEMQNEAAEIELLATYELGVMIGQKQQEGKLARQDMGGANIPNGVPNKNTVSTLSDIGISRKESSTSKKISSLERNQFEQILEGQKQKKKRITLSGVLRDIAKENKQDSPIMPSGKFRVIYADPPWKYNDKLTDDYGSAEHHYPTMSIQELCDMVLPDTDDNAVLFLWVTSPLLEESFRVIKAWGFKYKTSFIWDKVRHNMGHYNSVRHELLLVCTKGSCTPDVMKLFDSVQTIERSNKHSEKPEEFRKIIDTIYTHGNKIELFSRKEVFGWKTFGNELQQIQV